MKKFYEFKNITSSEADLFVYGEIVQEKSVDWWTGEESKTDVGLMEFKEELDNIGNVQKLNKITLRIFHFTLIHQVVMYLLLQQ